MTHRGFMVYNVLLGLALAGVVTLGVLVILDISDRVASNQGQIDRLDDLTRKLRRLTNPSPAEYRQQLRLGIHRCLAEPECRRLFPGVSRRSSGSRRTGFSSGDSSPLSPRPSSPAGSRERQGGQAVSDEGTSPKPKKPSPSPDGSESPPSEPPTPPAPATPVPTLTVPVPASVCTPLLRINC